MTECQFVDFNHLFHSFTALSTSIALIIYPVSIETTEIPAHTYGAGYGFGWGSLPSDRDYYATSNGFFVDFNHMFNSFTALSTSIALIIYPVSIETAEIPAHTYGAGYGFGWGSAFFFLVSAFCMSLDEVVRESSKAKCCKLCFKSRNSERAELQSV